MALLAVGEEAGGLNDNVNAELAPGQVGGVALVQSTLMRMAVGDDALVIEDTSRSRRRRPWMESYFSRWASVGMSAEVVNGDDLDVGGRSTSGAEDSYGRCGRSR